jgi:hypothetical protein
MLKGDLNSCCHSNEQKQMMGVYESGDGNRDGKSIAILFQTNCNWRSGLWT